MLIEKLYNYDGDTYREGTILTLNHLIEVLKVDWILLNHVIIPFFLFDKIVKFIFQLKGLSLYYRSIKIRIEKRIDHEINFIRLYR